MSCSQRLNFRWRPAGRSRAALGLSLAAALALAAGCGSSAGSGSGGSAGQHVHLTYALRDPVQEVGYKKSIALFEKSHPNISVTVEQIPYPDYEAKLTSEFTSGAGPDVFWVNTPFLAQFEQANVMLNLAPLIKKSHLNMSAYRPALVALHSHNGAIYGLPKDWDTEGIFYNKTYFAQHHIKIPASLTWNPTTGGSFLTLAREATTDKNGTSALSPKFSPAAIATYGVSVINQPDIGYGPFLASAGVPVFEQASLAGGVKVLLLSQVGHLQHPGRRLRHAVHRQPGAEVPRRPARQRVRRERRRADQPGRDPVRPRQDGHGGGG